MKTDYNASTSLLFKSLRTVKLPDITKIQIASIMQRYHTNSLSPYLMNMFSINANIHNYFTRSFNQFHRWTFSNDRSKHSIRHTGPTLWNSLDLCTFNLQFNNTFKRKYKKKLLSNY